MSVLESGKPKKIGGFDRYEVENAVRVLKEAEEIKANSKFLRVVLGEMNKESNKLEQTADLLTKTRKRLGKVFDKNG